MERTFPAAQEFLRATNRWSHNLLSPEEGASEVPAFREFVNAPWVPLPPPEPCPRSVGGLLSERHSCRRFLPEPLSLSKLGSLLGAGFGVQGRAELGEHELLTRPHPSGGGLYPVEIYLLQPRDGAVSAGVHHYSPQAHGLEQLRRTELPRPFLSRLFLGQPYVAQAGAIVVFTAVLERSMRKYGDRGLRYIWIEAGHAAQNLNLLALSLGLGSLNLGGFFDQELAELLGVDFGSEPPLYAVAIGHPATNDRELARHPPG